MFGVVTGQKCIRSTNIGHFPIVCLTTWIYVAEQVWQALIIGVQEWNTYLVNDWASEFGTVTWICGAWRWADHCGWIRQQWNTSGTSRW